MKRKLTKNEIVLIVILSLSLIAVAISHKRIGDRLTKVLSIYTQSNTNSETNK